MPQPKVQLFLLLANYRYAKERHDLHGLHKTGPQIEVEVAPSDYINAELLYIQLLLDPKGGSRLPTHIFQTPQRC